MATIPIIIYTSVEAGVRHSCQPGYTTINVDTVEHLSAAQRELLATRIVMSSLTSVDGCQPGQWSPSLAGCLQYAAPPKGDIYYDVAPATVEGLVASLDAELARRAEKDAEFAAYLEFFVTCPVGELLDRYGEKRAVPPKHYGAMKRRTGTSEIQTIDKLVGRQEQVFYEIARREVETAEQDRANWRDIAAWLREIGKDEMAGRAEAGVLPEDELRDVVLDALRMSLGSSRWALDKRHLVFDEYDTERYEGRMTWTAAQWAVMEEQKKEPMPVGLGEGARIEIVAGIARWSRDPSNCNSAADKDGTVKIDPVPCLIAQLEWHGREWSLILDLSKV